MPNEDLIRLWNMEVCNYSPRPLELEMLRRESSLPVMHFMVGPGQIEHALNFRWNPHPGGEIMTREGELELRISIEVDHEPVSIQRHWWADNGWYQVVAVIKPRGVEVNDPLDVPRAVNVAARQNPLGKTLLNG